MVATYIAIIFSFCFHNTVFAQIRIEPKPPVKRSVEVEKAREQTRWMYKNLSLEPDQYEKVSATNLLYAYKSDSVEKIKSKDLKTQSLKILKESKEDQMKKILTEQQYKQYIAHKEKQTSQKKSPFTGTYLGN